MSKRVVLVFAQRGGAGKSTVSRSVVDVLRYRGQEVEAQDGDATMGQLAALYALHDDRGAYVEGQSPIEGVGLFDVRDERDREALLTFGQEADWGAVIDLPAGSHNDLERVVPDGLQGLLTFYAEAGFEPVLLQVVSPFRACAQSVFEIAPAVEASGATWIVALNEFFCPSREFVMLLGDERRGSSGAAAARIEEAGGVLTTWPALRTPSYAYVDAFKMRFRDAAAKPPVDRRFAADPLWVRKWLSEVEQRIEHFGWVPAQSAQVSA